MIISIRIIIFPTIDEFIEKLSDSDVETYKKFTDIYPELSAGGMFNPFFSSNVVDIYDNVNTEIKKRGYLVYLSSMMNSENILNQTFQLQLTAKQKCYRI